MVSLIKIVLFAFLVLAIASPQVPYIGTTLGIQEAHAQQRKRKSLFEVLFQRRQKTRAKLNEIRKKRRNLLKLPGVRTGEEPQQVKKKERIAAPAPAVVVVKNENAPKILVVGDFIAGGLASGLEKLYADNANIVIVNQTSPSSGIVRDDVVDWATRTPELIEEIKPIAVISLVGMNDRQQMRLESGRVEKLTEPWKAEYTKRVTGIVTAGTAKQIPTLWVGLPPVKSGRMNADYLAFNEISRGVTEASGGIFVDVWDGFTNAEGKFVSAGPDINGQIVRLRGSKGINMTRAGKAKLAFFADKELRKIGVIGNPEGFEYASLGTINPNVAQPGVPEYNPAETGKTPVIPLGSPVLDGGDLLEGEKDILGSDGVEDSVSFELVRNGLPKLPQDGRIDSAWGSPKKIEEKTAGQQKPEETTENSGQQTQPETVSN